MELVSLFISLISFIIAVRALLLQLKSNKQIKEIQSNQIKINQEIKKLHDHIEETEGTIRMSIH